MEATSALIRLYLRTAMDLRIDRIQIERYKNRRRKHSLGDFDQEDRLVIFQRPMPTLRKPSAFMSVRDWMALWQWVPARYRLLDLDLLYSLETDGRHLMNVLKQCRGVEPVILLIETGSGAVVGGYLSKAICLDHGPAFYGTGETFIFSLRPGEPRKFSWSPHSTGMHSPSKGAPMASGHHAIAAKDMGAEGRSPSFICVTNSFVALGAGGDFGLWFDRTLTKVASGRCETFANESLLASSEGRHDSEQNIYSMEIFRFC
jgi:hypothetical protein